MAPAAQQNPPESSLKTRIVTECERGDIREVASRISLVVSHELGGEEPALLLLFASTAQPLGEFMRRVAARFDGSVVLGASTAGEFTENGMTHGTVSYFALAGDFKVSAGLGTGVARNPRAAVRAALDDQATAIDGYPYRTGILLLDPLSGRSEQVVQIARELLGNSVAVAGGAAGDDLKMVRAEVAFGADVASDALVLATVHSRSPLGMGVCHGHEPLSQPLKVTLADGPVVYKINGRPAWDIWLEHTREHALSCGIDIDKLSPDEERAFLLRYEAGILAGSEYKIRAPLERSTDGSISFACAIPKGTVIQITESNRERQIASARTAAERARKSIGDRPVAGALVFDCICRSLILGSEFSHAVQEISKSLGNVPLCGFETYGEIALNAGDLSGFHNTTTVVLAFPAD